jgi:hypothetical protein
MKFPGVCVYVCVCVRVRACVLGWVGGCVRACVRACFFCVKPEIDNDDSGMPTFVNGKVRRAMDLLAC